LFVIAYPCPYTFLQNCIPLSFYRFNHLVDKESLSRFVLKLPSIVSNHIGITCETSCDSVIYQEFAAFSILLSGRSFSLKMIRLVSRIIIPQVVSVIGFTIVASIADGKCHLGVRVQLETRFFFFRDVYRILKMHRIDNESLLYYFNNRHLSSPQLSSRMLFNVISPLRHSARRPTQSCLFADLYLEGKRVDRFSSLPDNFQVDISFP